MEPKKVAVPALARGVRLCHNATRRREFPLPLEQEELPRTTQKDLLRDVARSYADQIVLSGMARVDSTLRLGELGEVVGRQGITQSGLRALLSTNPQRFAYHDRRWVPVARLETERSPLNWQIQRTLELYGAPMPLADLALELSKARHASVEFFEKHLPRILSADPNLLYLPSGWAALADWVFIARDESEEDALFLNGLSEEDVKPWAGSVGRIDYSNLEAAAKSALRHVPISAKVIGFFAWRQLNPPDPYVDSRYDPGLLFDALMSAGVAVYGVDGNFYAADEAEGWIRSAVRSAERMEPVIDVEDSAPLEFAPEEVEQMVSVILSSPASVSVGDLLAERYDLSPADRTYPEDLANAMAAIEATGAVWYVGGDRYRQPETAPDFVWTVPDIFHFVNYDFRDQDDQPIDVELSDDGFSSALRKEMQLPAAMDVLDEDPQPVPRKMPESVTLVLKAHHREIGTFPMCQFPPGWFASEPTIQEVVFRDPQGRELNPWLNHDTRLLYNLVEWWFDQPVESGARFILRRTGRPNVFDFEWLEEPDPLLFISSERMEELRDLAGRSAELSTYEILMEVLSHYPKGTDYLTALAETNVVRRTTRRLVASLLTGYHCFYQRSGSTVWHFDPKRVDQGFDKAKRKFIRT
ncbi:MAG: hypothetical protein C4341_09520 [Armatimonadota bacterium]